MSLGGTPEGSCQERNEKGRPQGDFASAFLPKKRNRKPLILLPPSVRKEGGKYWGLGEPHHRGEDKPLQANLKALTLSGEVSQILTFRHLIISGKRERCHVERVVKDRTDQGRIQSITDLKKNFGYRLGGNDLTNEKRGV